MNYLLTLLASAITTAVSVLLLPWLDLANLIMLYLLMVLVIAIRLGRGPATLAALLSVALFDFFLVPPRLSFAVEDVQYLITFAVMLTVALTTAHLAANLRQQAEAASQRERQTRLLYELARELAGALTVEHVALSIRQFLRGIGMDAALLLPDAEDVLQVRDMPGETAPRLDRALAAAAYAQNTRIELDRLAAFDEAVLYLPLKAPMRVRGVLAVHAPDAGLAALKAHEQLLEATASLIAIAVERLHYIEIAHATQVKMQSERLRSAILSALSHDVRTPLAALVGLADSLTLVRPPLSSEATHDTAVAIREQASRLHGMVENLLDMARLNAGEVRLRKDWCLIEDVVASSLKLLRPALQHHHVQLNLAGDLPLVEFDAVLIERVLCNLLENAAKYSPPGAMITIRADCRDAWLWVSVCDNGPGLPEGPPEALFDLFVRGHAESTTPGTGLGLAICKAIIEAHEGQINALTQVTGGTCLHFALPLTTAPALDDEAVILARRGLS